MKHLIVDSEGIKLAEMPDERDYLIDDDGVERFKAAKKQAIAEAKLFEDQERVKELLRPQFYSKEWDKTETEFLKLPTGTYPLPPDFPEYVEVIQWKYKDNEFGPPPPWNDFIEPITGRCYEFRTILRFVDKQGPIIVQTGKLINKGFFVDKQEQRKEESQEKLWGMIKNQCVYNDGYFDIEKAKELATIKRK